MANLLRRGFAGRGSEEGRRDGVACSGNPRWGHRGLASGAPRKRFETVTGDKGYEGAESRETMRGSRCGFAESLRKRPPRINPPPVRTSFGVTCRILRDEFYGAVATAATLTILSTSELPGLETVSSCSLSLIVRQALGS